MDPPTVATDGTALDMPHVSEDLNMQDQPAPSSPYNLCDDRLHQLQIDKWTNVSINDSLAARAISLYLETDHPVLGLFDADLFLDGLISGETNFCSSLLVTAVLCWACVSVAFHQP